MKKRILACFMMLVMLVLCACSATPAPADPAPAEPAPPAAEYPAATWAPNGAINPGSSEPVHDWGEGAYYPRESYLEIEENTEVGTDRSSMLTFSLKVDTAAYANVRRYLESGSLPPRDAVRTEELINYFSYDQPLAFAAGDPFAIYTEVGPSPFDSSKHILFVRVKARELPREQLPPSSFTFLIDTSGSMQAYDKLPLLQQAFSMLVEQLDAEDMVSIITYAGSSQVVLEGARGSEKNRILRAINRLKAGGSTAGAQGIQSAYTLAERYFIPGGNNRVLLATDGDFNVGISSVEELNSFISKKRQTGVYLSVLGFGTGNIRDDIMETLAKNGNGNYSYIYDSDTAHKVLVEELTGNLFAIANDVKAQVEFNSENVSSYRLIGYENSMLENRDFADDKKDAGEIGVGTDVVVLFEIGLKQPGGGEYKYGGAPRVYAPDPGAQSAYADELLEVRIRYKHPGQAASNLMLHPVTFEDITNFNSSDFTFACSVAAFGELLRGNDSVGIGRIAPMASESIGPDAGGYRAAHVELLRQYGQLLRR